MSAPPVEIGADAMYSRSRAYVAWQWSYYVMCPVSGERIDLLAVVRFLRVRS